MIQLLVLQNYKIAGKKFLEIYRIGKAKQNIGSTSVSNYQDKNNKILTIPIIRYVSITGFKRIKFLLPCLHYAQNKTK